MDELNRPSVEDFKQSSKMPLIVVLDNIRSLHNVGSVFRTSDAFSIEKIVLTGITATPPHREIHKTALGATESVQWRYQENCVEALRELKRDGFRVVGVEQVSGSTALNTFGYSGKEKLALVFGNEVKGVDQTVLDHCDDFIEIPQSGTKHSLNVSVSVGVVLWELTRSLLK
ncbi:MAG: RNA methyltransferase [Flavobacteriales bacterium]|nr:RNA methyltransferase [Flavobacteriales bacterium]MCB9204742.1 RNA methyltransferase [Flavobacteriales bacterium]